MFPHVFPVLAAALIATQSSLVFDFVSRQKIGSTTMGLFIWKQQPVPTPATMEPTPASSRPASWNSSIPPTT